MALTFWDYFIIVAFLLLSLGVGLYYRRQAGKDLQNFFLGGRNLPWWLAGTSMIATTFAADTPLAVTELVSKNGISGNWLWWNMLAGGMLTTFFFAKYWRRANILTDLELIEIRYSGKVASFLRGFRAIYFGVFMNVIIMGWVNLALLSLIKVFFNVDDTMLYLILAGAMLLVVIYSALSGLLGVVTTDFVQFFIAMTGCIVLAVIVVNSESIGGIEGLKSKLPSYTLEFFPHVGTAAQAGGALVLGIGSFLAYIGCTWWASWYPGNEPGGGGYIAQRMMSTKNEKHSVYSTLLFQIGHYCLRPWPWIIVGLCAMVLYPGLAADQKRMGYVMAMRDYLPPGLRGLLLTAFFAAYMSTISTQLNWGTSYLINDFYKRYTKKKNVTPKDEVRVSRWVTVLLMILTLGVTSYINDISSVWQFLLECGAGLGLVLILRWYWWRINAWSEITATVVPIIAYALAHFVFDWVFPTSFFWTLGVTIVLTLLVTFFSPTTDKDLLQKFYDRIRPNGWWKPFRGEHPTSQRREMGLLTLSWLSAVVMAYAILFFMGKVIFHEWTEAGYFLLTAAFAIFVLRKASSRINIFKDEA